MLVLLKDKILVLFFELIMIFLNVYLLRILLKRFLSGRLALETFGAQAARLVAQNPQKLG